jgi:single-strand DNA-binding protein
MVNRVILVGNLTKDAEAIGTGEKAFTRMRVATNNVWKDANGNRQESSEFHSVVAFGRTAEVCAEYCSKGKKVYVEGRLKTREYAGNDGSRKFATDVIAETVKFLSPKNSASVEEAAA